MKGDGSVRVPLREALVARQELSGIWAFLDDAITTEVIARAGFDFVTIDLQHSYSTMSTADRLVEAVRAADVPAIVRVPWNTPDLIMRSLDLGAEGVIVPMVDTVDDARAAVASCRYAPAGRRSWGPLWQGVHPSFPDHEQGDRLAACIVMIETAAGYGNIDEIVRVEGLDAVYIGQNDLSLSSGLGRRTYEQSPVMHGMIDHVIESAHGAGIAVGLDCSGPEAAGYWRRRGVDFVIAANDVALLASAASVAARAVRQA